MKKFMLSMAVLAAISFTSCSSDDDAVDNCATCGIDLLGVVISSEYCDNGDGTMTVTVEGVSETVDLQGQSFDAFIQGLELSGATCN